MVLSRLALLSCLLLHGALAPPARAQAISPSAFSERLLEVLSDRGYLGDPELATLKPELRALSREILHRRTLQDAIAAAARVVPEESVRSTHRRGRGFSFETAGGEFGLEISGRLQTRFSTIRDDEGSEQFGFRIAQARLIVQGHAWGSWARYRFMIAWRGDDADTPVSLGSFDRRFSSSNLLAEVKDAYIDLMPASWLRLRLGQFRAPGARQSLTPAARLQFLDRSPLHDVFGAGRQRGAMVHGFVGADELVAYRIGVFSSTDENSLRLDQSPLFAGRWEFNPMGGQAYSEPDLRASDDPWVSFGVAGWWRRGSRVQDEQWTTSLDVAFKWRGLSLLGEIHYEETKDDEVPARAFGWFAQVGFMIVSETLELALRTAHIDFAGGASDTAVREHLLALNWYFEGHFSKIQAEFGRVVEHAQSGGLEEWRLQVQIQLVF